MAGSLDSRALEVFVAVAEAASMTGAAKMLGISQAAVSQQVARLEQGLGLRLVERCPRELRLTPAGAHLRHLGRRVLAELAQAERAMKRFQGYAVPHLSVGLMESMSEILSGTIVTALENQVQHLEVHSALNYRYRDSLLEETLDLVVSPVASEEPGIEVHRLATEPLILAVPKNYWRDDEVDLEALAVMLPQARLVARRLIGRLVEQYLARQVVVVQRAFDFDHTSIVLDAVRHGQAWAVVTPFVLVHADLHGHEFDVFPLPGTVPTRTISLASKAGRFGDLPRRLAVACRETIHGTVCEQLPRIAPRVANTVTVHRD